jgi:hypothetical protein
MTMKDAVLAFDTPEGREAAIAEMMANLTASRDRLEHGSIDERGVSLLMALMPAFVRGLDRERLLFIEERKAGDGKAIDDIDDHLMVMALPIVNMIGSVITTLIPGNGSLRTVERVRLKMLNHLLCNIASGVEGYMTHPDTLGADHARLHS